MLLTRVRFPSPAPGLLAQLVRALPSHGRGRWFESSTAHHFGTIPFFRSRLLFYSSLIWSSSSISACAWLSSFTHLSTSATGSSNASGT